MNQRNENKQIAINRGSRWDRGKEGDVNKRVQRSNESDFKHQIPLGLQKKNSFHIKEVYNEVVFS